MVSLRASGHTGVAIPFDRTGGAAALGSLVLRGLSGEQPDWGSFRLKYNSLSQKCRFYGIFASCLRATRSAALTVHRTVIHDRRLRVAYPQPEGAEGGFAAGSNELLHKLQFDAQREGHCPSRWNTFNLSAMYLRT